MGEATRATLRDTPDKKPTRLLAYTHTQTLASSCKIRLSLSPTLSTSHVNHTSHHARCERAICPKRRPVRPSGWLSHLFALRAIEQGVRLWVESTHSQYSATSLYPLSFNSTLHNHAIFIDLAFPLDLERIWSCDVCSHATSYGPDLDLPHTDTRILQRHAATTDSRDGTAGVQPLRNMGAS